MDVPGDEGDASLWDDFGQKVDLTARLREILLNYPEGTSILKELVQNADDAGARTVKVCLDERSHGTDTLAYERLAQFQGPSLLVFNDSTFKESDFESISRIGDSVKRTQVGKTGRFGVGFNSVYHLTDMPSFVSGRHVVFFDPSCAFLPNVTAANPGKRVDFVSNAGLADKHPDQWTPFAAFGCDVRSEFPGTMFRFPLRTEAQALTSRLSKAHYTAQSVRQLLIAFANEKTLDMLYLKNVECVEVLEWRVGEDAPRVMATSTLRLGDEAAASEIRRHRSAFSRASASMSSNPQRIKEVFTVSFDSTATGVYARDDTRTSTYGTRTSTDGTRTFVVSHALGTELTPLVDSGREKFGMKLVPWAAVAAELGTDPTCADKTVGRAFTFLPLPVKTGLPVHVNAYFELSSNRRDIWFGGDMAGGGAARSEWNQALLSKVVAPCYARLVIACAGKLGPSPAFYALLPETNPPEPWGCVVRELYCTLTEGDAKVLHTPANGGRWIAPKDAVYPDPSLASDDILRDALVAEGLTLTDAPGGVLERIEEHAVRNPKRVSPAGVRQTLREKGEDGIDDRPRERVLVLLRYVLSDIIDDEPASAAELDGVPLFPLADGSTAVVRPGGVGARALYVPDETECLLLSRASDRCVDRTCDVDIVSRLETLANTRALNLSPIDDDAVVDLMPSILPHTWTRAGGVGESARRTYTPVPWDDAVASDEYMALVWRVLGSVCLDHASLGKLEGFPLLPVIDTSDEDGNDRIQYAVIPLGAPTIDSTGVSNETAGALRAAGVYVLATTTAAGACAGRHPAIRDTSAMAGFLSPASAAGVADAVSKSIASMNASMNGTQTPWSPAFTRGEAALVRGFVLRRRWFGAGARSGLDYDAAAPDRLATLSSLRIYESFPEPLDDETDDTAVRPQLGPLLDLRTAQLSLAPPRTDPALLGADFLNPSTDEEAAVLVERFGVELLTDQKFLRTRVLPRLDRIRPARVRNDAMLDALGRLPSLCAGDRSLSRAIAISPFVPTACGKLAAPAHLYDPRIPELVELLDVNNSFPTAPFDDDVTLGILASLGMRSTVTQTAVMDAAMTAERLGDVDGDGYDPAGAAERGWAILRYLETSDGTKMLIPDPVKDVKSFFGQMFNQNKDETKEGDTNELSAELPREAFVSQLSAVAWVPVATDPPRSEPGLPWPKNPSPVAPPHNSRPPNDAWLCSATMRVLTREPQSSALADVLGWRREVSVGTLAGQLLALGAKHPSIDDSAVGRALAAAVPRVYALLTASLNSRDFEGALAPVRDAAVVWVGTGFARARSVAFSGALDLKPYLHVLPADLTCFRPLLTALGVRDAFGAGDYVRLLRGLTKDTGGGRLDSNQLELALWVLGTLADYPPATLRVALESSSDDSNDAGESSGSLPVPDASGTLVPASDVRFNDAPWLAAPEGVRLAHPKLPSQTAEACGVRSLRLALLAEASEDIDVQLHGSAEAFGQHEALTTRLKHILDAYADGPGVISELVQNADDAGATEVRLLLDQTGGGDKSLLGPKMARWQGPALVAWNDAVFSPNDFHNIARIGQDSKIDAPAAAGRFGLGFNAVYHFTDLPSFVSGDYLVMFDPHATHLPGATPARPGLKIAFGASPLLSQFPDQFGGYLDTFGCDLTSSYDATMFRFPLRTEEAARASEIKPEAYTPTQVRSLFTQFKERATQTLLFLKNVRKIGVYERSGDSRTPKLVYEVSIPSFQDERDPRAATLQWVAGNSAVVRGVAPVAAVKKQQFVEKLRTMPERSLPTSVGWMDLQMRVSSSEPADEFIGDEEPDGLGSTNKVIVGTSVTRERWMVCSSLAGGKARALALSDTGVSRGLVPWVGVAARVPHPDESPEQFIESFRDDGRAFCFLPLPVKTGLPVHVNAYFELSSNRRDIWFGGDMAGGGAARSEWNQALLTDAVAPAYAKTLEAAAQTLGPSPAFYRLFPTAKSHNAPWSLILPPLYSNLLRCPCLRATDPLQGAEISSRWVAPATAMFPDGGEPAAPALADALRAEGVWLIEGAPKDVCESFARHCEDSDAVRTLSPAAVRAMLRRTDVPHPALDSRKRALALLEYVLSDVNPADPMGAADLTGVPLVPLTNGTLGTFAFRGGRTDGAEVMDETRQVEEGGPKRPPSHAMRPRDKAPTFLVPHESEVDLLGECAGDVLVDRELLCGGEPWEGGDSLTCLARLERICAGSAGAELNVKVFDGAALASLMPRIMPRQWGAHPQQRAHGYVGCGAVVEWRPDAKEGHPSAATLALLWRRLAALCGEDLSAFQGWPLLPIGGGASLAPLIPHGPVVRGEGWTENTRDALLAMRVQSLDENEVSQAIVSHPRVGDYVRPATAAGVLDSAVAAAALDPAVAASVPADASPEERWRAAARAVPEALIANAHALGAAPNRRALRSFLIQKRWFQRGAPGGTVEGARLDLVRSLPVFETYSQSLHGHKDADSTEGFVCLASTPPPLLAPVGAEEDLLPPPFLKLDGETEASILETHAGVVRVTPTALLSDGVLPALAEGRLQPSCAPRALDAVFAALVNAKASWTGAGDVEHLSKSVRANACVPTPSGALKRPDELFDPRVQSLRELLDPREHFPVAPFDSGDRVEALVSLGVRRSLGAEGLVASARSVEKMSASNFDVAAAVARGRGLLAHLNALAAATAKGGTELPPPGAVIRRDEETDEPATVSVWRELSSLAWCPALTQPPHPAMPWPNKGSSRALPPLAAPRATRPPSDAWASSSCMRVLDLTQPEALATPEKTETVEKVETVETVETDTPHVVSESIETLPDPVTTPNDVVLEEERHAAEVATETTLRTHESLKPMVLEPLLVDRLGWNKLGSAVVAAQLLELGKSNPACDPDSEFARTVNEELPRAYAKLAEAAGSNGAGSSSADLDAAGTILRDARWLWTGSGFVKSADVAVDCPGDLRPYLHGVPSELAAHTALLTALGVRAGFGAEDFARAANSLAIDSGGSALTDEKIELAAALAEAAADALAPPPSQIDDDVDGPSAYPSVPGGEPVTARKVANDVCGKFMLPDHGGVMTPAAALVNNDADWLAEGARGTCRLVHPSVSQLAAEVLGARSLRDMFAVDKGSTDRLPCPSELTLRRLLPMYNDSAFFLADVVEIADAVGAREIEVALDTRTYPAMSLLLPQLADFQGPAVTVKITGASLQPEEIAQLLSAAAPFKLRRRVVRFGNGLVTACHVTDAVFAVSAGRLCVFDPTGQALGGGGKEGASSSFKEGAGSSSDGSAKSYALDGGELASRFVDQYAPFIAAGADRAGAGNCTVLRFPLRTEDQAANAKALSPVAFAGDGGVESTRNELARFAADAHKMLLFASSLTDIKAVCRHVPRETPMLGWEHNDGGVELLVDVHLAAPPPVKSSSSGAEKPTPRNIVDDKEWRRATLTTLFGGGNSTRTAHVVQLTESAGHGGGPVTDTWVVGAAIGVGKARDIALDRKSANQMLLPLAAAASHVARDGAHVDPASPPPSPALKRFEGFAVMSATSGKDFIVDVPKPGRGVWGFRDFGLSSPAQRSTTPGDETTDGVYGEDGLLSVADTLGRMPAVVMAHFALERGGERRLAGFLDDPGQVPGQVSGPGAARREWNRALCQCLAAAYGAMVGHARVAPTPELPADTFYAMWPRAERTGLPAPPALDPDGRPIVSGGAPDVVQTSARVVQTSARLPGHPVAELVLYPVYKELVDQPLFRSLGSRALVKPADGYFLPAGFAVNEGLNEGSNGASWAGFAGSSNSVARPLAAAFIARHFPVLDAPASLRPELAAAGAVAAARELTAAALRKLLRSKPPPSDLRTHVELVECACSDIDPGVGVASSARVSAPPSPSRQGTIPAMFGQRRDQPGGDAIDGIMSVVNEMFGQAGIAPPGNGVQPLDVAAVRDLSGVPVPTASGAPAALGHQSMYSGSENMVALVPTLRGKFLHPSMTASPTLGALIRHAQFRSELRVSVFTPAQLAAELPNVLPRRLTPAGCGSVPVVPWSEDGSDSSNDRVPSARWLRAFWDEIAPQGPVAVDAFAAWPLVPIRGGELVRVGHRAAVTVPPAPTVQESHPLSPDPLDSSVMSHTTLDGTFDGRDGDVDGVNDITFAPMSPNQTPPRGAGGSIRDALFGSPSRAGLGSPARRTDVTAAKKAVEDEWHWLEPMLRVTGAPVLDWDAAGEACARMLDQSVENVRGATVRTAADVIAFKAQQIRACLGAGRPSFALVDEETRGRLFTVLATQHIVSGFAASEEGLEVIRSFPVFATVVGEWTDLTSGEYVTCPPGVAFAETLRSFSGLLEFKDDARDFYKALGVPELADADVLARFIVPSLEQMNASGRTAALTYLRRHWPRLKDSEPLCDALKSARFVEANGTDALMSPGNLYDPEVELLHAVFRGQTGAFPAGAWLDGDWLDLLREVGLRSTVDATLFQLCATRVAARAIGLGIAYPTEEGGKKYPPVPPAPTSADLALAETAAGDESDADADDDDEEAALDKEAGLVIAAGAMLADHLVDNIAHLYTANMCEVVLGVPFVPAALGVPGAPGPGCVGCNVLTSFSHAMLPEHWASVFMHLPVLPAEFVPPQFARSRLRVKSEPGASAIAAHLIALGSPPSKGGGVAALARWTPAAGDPCTAVSTALGVLGDCADALEDAELTALSEAAFVPVAGGAATEAPNRLFLRAPNRLAPLAFELPSALTEHAGFLRRLGLRDELTPADADAALRVAARNARGSPLGPNELRAAVAALRHATGDDNESNDDSNRPRGVTRVSTIPVPDSFGVLAPSTCLMHAWGAPQSLLHRLDRRKLRLAHELVPASACHSAGIRAVKDAVFERHVTEHDDDDEDIDEPPDEPLETPTEGDGSSSEGVVPVVKPPRRERSRVGKTDWPEARAFAAALARDAFADALHVVMRASMSSVPTVELLREILRDVSGSFRVVHSLRTGLAAESVESGEIADVTYGSPVGTHAFHDTRSKRVYVSPPSDSNVPAAPLIARAVVSALGLNDHDAAAVTPAVIALSASNDDATMHATAAALAPGGGSSRVAMDPAHGHVSKESARGDPGSLVLPRDARLLTARPLRPLVSGETVAVREGGGAYLTPGEAAAAAAESRRTSGGAVNEERYVYARVIASARPAKGAALTRVHLEVGPRGERREALSSEVFTFRLVSELEEDAGAGASADSGPGGSESTRHTDRDAGDEPASTPGAPAGDEQAGASARDVNDEEDTLNAAVTSEELVRAVRDLLTAAGAPPSMDQSALLAANQRLQAELEDASAAVAAAERDIASAESHGKKVEKAFLCPITQGVMTDPVIALDGHTYEKRAIEQWFSQGRLTSPVTNLRLNSTTLVPNHALRGAITAHESKRGE